MFEWLLQGGSERTEHLLAASAARGQDLPHNFDWLARIEPHSPSIDSEFSRFHVWAGDLEGSSGVLQGRLGFPGATGTHLREYSISPFLFAEDLCCARTVCAGELGDMLLLLEWKRLSIGKAGSLCIEIQRESTTVLARAGSLCASRHWNMICCARTSAAGPHATRTCEYKSMSDGGLDRLED